MCEIFLVFLKKKYVSEFSLLDKRIVNTPHSEDLLDQLILVNQQIMTSKLCMELNINFSAWE